MTDFILGVIVDYMPKFKLKIFLPAAGLGERMRPITNHIPKPLLPILGRPLIELIIEKFSTVSSGKIGINLHYKADMVKEWIKNSAYAGRIELFPEDPILGTGGALKNAEAFLSEGNFLVHNSDIISDIDFSRLIETHLSHGNIATLATHDYIRYNNVVIDDNGCVIDVENSGTSTPNPDRIAKKVAYTGIAVYSPEIFNFVSKGVSHATVAWIAASKAGHRVQALDFTGCYWNDIGNPVSYASEVVNSLKKEGETVFMHPLSNDCMDTDLNGFAVIERDCVLGKGVQIRNCIVLPESKTEKNSHYENCIIGPDFKISLNESEVLGYSDKVGGVLIGIGGSDRKYYRVRRDDKTVVIMQCEHNDLDFLRHIEYTKFFSGCSIPVPELISIDPEKMRASFEDLGDVTLYSWLKCRRRNEDIEKMYRKVMDISVMLHTKATEYVSKCPTLINRAFDYEHFRWETNYFVERFVSGMRNIRIRNPSALEDEFHRIALKADSYPKTVMHRDFQSKNIMIHNWIPRLIDYQGARIGLPAYDVASILWDPYFRLEDGMRERLLAYYISEMRAKSNKFDERIFMESLLLCRLQRHMQALGAYGFLSSVKGKKYFLKHITEGLRLLKEDISLTKDKYPELNKLVMSL
ncbi:MAG: phosphotransferase [Nitrospirae bacterium]|nr:phosphotransferase [Nitrospirota bacterium]